MKTYSTVVILGLLLLTPCLSQATPVAFGDNYYEFVQVQNPYSGNNNSWVAASSAASTSVFNSVNGHLATITSKAENDFLFSLVSGMYSGFTGAWIGGTAVSGWLTGPESGQNFSYTNWGGIEPNNMGYTYMSIGSPYTGIQPGQWVDDSGIQGFPDSYFDPVIGYFVEYENAATLPEPGGLLLFAAGLLGLARIFHQPYKSPLPSQRLSPPYQLKSAITHKHTLTTAFSKFRMQFLLTPV